MSAPAILPRCLATASVLREAEEGSLLKEAEEGSAQGGTTQTKDCMPRLKTQGQPHHRHLRQRPLCRPPLHSLPPCRRSCSSLCRACRSCRRGPPLLLPTTTARLPRGGRVTQSLHRAQMNPRQGVIVRPAARTPPHSPLQSIPPADAPLPPPPPPPRLPHRQLHSSSSSSSNNRTTTATSSPPGALHLTQRAARSTEAAAVTAAAPPGTRRPT